MEKVGKKFLLLFLFLLTNECLSQNNAPIKVNLESADSIMALVKTEYKWMGTFGLTVSDEMKLKYHKPRGFWHEDSFECFKDYPKLESTFSCKHYQLHSNDGQFIAFLEFVPQYTKKLEATINGLFPQHAKELVDKQHRLQMRARIRAYYGDEIGESWVDSIQQHPTKEAREKFNADSVFSFSIRLRPSDYYKKEFKNMKALLIQRNGRGYVCIYSFYTDKAKAKFKKYWRRIEKTLHYED
jgi:hypothetical protein